MYHELRYFHDNRLNKLAFADNVLFPQKPLISSILQFELMWQSRYLSIKGFAWKPITIYGITAIPFSLLLAKLGFIVLKILDRQVLIHSLGIL